MNTNTSTNTTRWIVDPGHSLVGFSVRHLMITNVHGEFSSFRGQLSFDPAHPETAKLSASIDVATLNTREAKRDADLRGSLFFDADNHPQMTFVSRIACAVEHGIDLTGELTIRGVTREMTLAVRDICGPQPDMRGKPRIGASASTKIKRSDFGMTWNKTLETAGVVVGDIVTIVLEASLVPAE